jgi:hypothetical protein
VCDPGEPLVKRATYVWVFVVALSGGVLGVGCRRQAERGAGHTVAGDTSFAAMQARGAMVMGVDQYTSHHVFEDLPDGGRIVLDNDDGADTAAIGRIREHMRDIAMAFGRGDFAKPLAVHGMPVPGSAVMAARRSAIRYEEMDRPRGAEVRILATDSVAVAAVHAFLAFQRGAHHAAARLPAPSLPADSLFDRLIGQWVLRGTIAREATTHDVTFDWLLGREYVQMHEVSRERTANGAAAYEAVVLFGRDPRTGEYACLWLDNTAAGAFAPQGIGRGTVAGDSIPFVFHYTPAESFHTTFVYDGATDSWQWHMDNDSAGVRQPFARVTLTRRERGSAPPH